MTSTNSGRIGNHCTIREIREAELFLNSCALRHAVLLALVFGTLLITGLLNF